MPRRIRRSPAVALAALSAGCFHAPPPPHPARPAKVPPPYTCTAPAPAAPAAPATRDTPRALGVALVSGEVPDWGAWETVQATPAPAAMPAAPAWGGVQQPAAAPVWGAAAPAQPAAPEWGAAAPAAAPALAAPATAAPAWGAQAATPDAGSWGTAPASAASEADRQARVQQWFRDTADSLSLKVIADGAPLGSLALAVGAQFELPVVVQTGLADRSITLSASQMSLGDLGRLLREVHGVALSFEEGVLVVSDLDAFIDRNYDTEPAPLETVLLPSPDGVPAAHFAATWCDQAASERGKAAVVGRTVSFQDDAGALERARRLQEELSAASTALIVDDSAADSPTE